MIICYSFRNEDNSPFCLAYLSAPKEELEAKKVGNTVLFTRYIKGQPCYEYKGEIHDILEFEIYTPERRFEEHIRMLVRIRVIQEKKIA